MKKDVLILVIAVFLADFSCFIVMYPESVKGIEKLEKVITPKKEPTILGSFSSSLDEIDTYYLALNGEKKLDFKFEYPDDFDKTFKVDISNEEIISFENNTIKGLQVGESDLTLTLKDTNKKTYHIIVTDLIIPASLETKKEVIPCNRFSEEENTLLDKILESRVKEAGVGTRGAALAVARFLTLEFPYSIPYFYENGRLEDQGLRTHRDGEGRFYHKGLYLNKVKYNELEKNASSKSGPQTWGCKLYEGTRGAYKPNGLDCSGFLSWVMYNAGYDVGDIGAGCLKDVKKQFCLIGENKKITPEYMQGNTYKVGDVIGRFGHIGIIIGIDEKNIYTAESLEPKLKVHVYERYSKIVKDDNLTYVIEMDSIYPNGEGRISDMW